MQIRDKNGYAIGDVYCSEDATDLSMSLIQAALTAQNAQLIAMLKIVMDME